MKKITRWTADTCGCIVEYEWDDDGNDFTDKTHTFHDASHVCESHKGIRIGKMLFQAVERENVNKNLAYKALVEETDFGQNEIIDERQTRRLKEDLEFEYQFIGDDPEHRTLEFSLLDKKSKQRVKIPDKDMNKIDNALRKNKNNRLMQIADISKIKTK